MTQHDISKQVLDTIHKKQLQPHARWQFQFRRTLLWLLVLMTIGVASFAIGTTLSIAHSSDWDMYKETGELSQPVFVFLLSYFWILLFSTCLIATYALFVRTRHGYRYRFLPLAGGIVGSGLLFGGCIFFSGVGHQIDTQCERIIPGYGEVLSQSHQLWVQPDKGRLAGIVEHIKAPLTFTVVDPYGRLWLVQTDANLHDTVSQLQEKRTVHMTGSQVNNTTFHAKTVRMYQVPSSFVFFALSKN